MNRGLLAACLCLLPLSSAAGEALVAVATNFTEVMSHLQTGFESETDHTLRVTNGSTGKLYAQIVAGAPFDVLLAADQARPERLEAEGLAVAGSRFTYATGAISLWSADPELIGGDGAAVLRAGGFRRLAIANPELAPYGIAARQALQALCVWTDVAPRLVMGENIGQVFGMVATGNAELGVVATSQLLGARRPPTGSTWEIPPHLYQPIRQDAVLLRRASGNDAARAFLRFLRQDAVRADIRAFGYAADSGPGS